MLAGCEMEFNAGVSRMKNWRAKGGEDLSLGTSRGSVTLLQTGLPGHGGYFGSSHNIFSSSYLNYTTSGGRFTLETSLQITLFSLPIGRSGVGEVMQKKCENACKLLSVRCII